MKEALLDSPGLACVFVGRGVRAARDPDPGHPQRQLLGLGALGPAAHWRGRRREGSGMESSRRAPGGLGHPPGGHVEVWRTPGTHAKCISSHAVPRRSWETVTLFDDLQ